MKRGIGGGRAAHHPHLDNHARKRRGKPGGQASGVIAGKVTMPDGEPVAYVYVENMRAPAKKNAPE